MSEPIKATVIMDSTGESAQDGKYEFSDGVMRLFSLTVDDLIMEKIKQPGIWNFIKRLLRIGGYDYSFSTNKPFEITASPDFKATVGYAEDENDNGI